MTKRTRWLTGLSGLILGLVLGHVVLTQAQNFSSVQVGSGSSFAPSITFLADNKKGFFDNGTNSIGATVNQTVGMQLTQSANQGVEVVLPGHVVGCRNGDPTPAAPTGQGTSTIVGCDYAGRITIGTGGAGALTLTFAKAGLTKAACQFNDEVTASANPGKALGSLTNVVWTPLATTTTADTVTYTCVFPG